MNQQPKRVIALLAALVFTVAALYGLAVLPRALFAASDKTLLAAVAPRPLPADALSSEMAAIPLVKTLYDRSNLHANQASIMGGGYFSLDDAKQLLYQLLDDFEQHEVFSAAGCAEIREALALATDEIGVAPNSGGTLDTLGIYTIKLEYVQDVWPYTLEYQFLEADGSLVYFFYSHNSIGNLAPDLGFRFEHYCRYTGLDAITDWQKRSARATRTEQYSPTAQLCCVYNESTLDSFYLEFYSRLPQE